ncbi:molybdopterin-synthase small subunit [Bacteroides uniformis]|uniref:molybdopterin-synthase small subunit n=1 Tax=Bacteroides uniformis TaxID=820 RepID=UPI001D08EA03|nr:molybdopterin-synthase small subunit [Bacteroides uniformis]MCB6701704.1 molybdopterin-synthase small subunit [Bacteroides uniformis]
MMDLRNIILEKKDQLPKQTGKLVNQLYSKIKLDSYFPDNKNVIKLKEFSTVEINNFLLECLTEYDKTERLFCEHHDIVGLRGVWAVLAFSKEENVLKYFDELIDKYIHGKPFYLHFLFALFGYSEIQHPLFDKIRKYYDEISDDLPAYKLLKNLNIVPSDKYNWCVNLVITTDGEWLIPSQLTDEEKEQRFSFEMRLSNPRTMGDTYEISIENEVSSRQKQIIFSDSRIWAMSVDKTVFSTPNLLNLANFVCEVENYFGIQFNFEKIAYLSVSKGINRKQIEKWVKNKFVI